MSHRQKNPALNPSPLSPEGAPPSPLAETVGESVSVTGKPLARYWRHSGMVSVGGEKMSESLGNFTTIRQLLHAPNGPEPVALRLFVLTAQYRKPMNFTASALAAAPKGWNSLKEGLLFGGEYGNQLGWESAG